MKFYCRAIVSKTNDVNRIEVNIFYRLGFNEQYEKELGTDANRDEAGLYVANAPKFVS